MPLSEHDTQELPRLLYLNAEGIERQERLQYLRQTWNSSIWSEEDDEPYTLPDPEIPLVYSLHYGQQCPPEWDDGSAPAETADWQKKNEHGRSNLHAEEDFLQKLESLNLDPRLKKLLITYEEVFGALPPPLSCGKLLLMDLKLKPEFEKTRVRRRPYPAPQEQVEATERQIQECIHAGLVEEYKQRDYPHHCSPCFLVAKPGLTALRLVVDYGEVNKKTQNHSGSILGMESSLERIAKCRYKTKMDKCSGFWQLDLTAAAQKLLAFITPKGRVFQWKVMPFGSANAPALFQELMNKFLYILRRRKMHKDAPPPPSPVKACFNPLPEPPDPELVEVHAPSSTPDVDVMFGVSLLGKIRHISLFSSPMARVRVYRVKYAHYDSALLAEGFTVSQLVLHPECPDTAARDNLLAPANPLVSEAQDFLSRVIEAATAYGSAEQLSLARDHYLSTSKPLSLTEKIAQLHLQAGKVFDPIREITGALISNEFFSEEEEALVMSYSADENHQWLSEGHRTMLHFGFRYNPESKEVEPFEPTPPEFIQAIGLRAFSACAQVLPSSLLCPNMWSVARYEPGSGLRSHVDVPQLGPYVLDGSFGSGAEMVFEPRPLPGSTLFRKRQKVFLQRRSLLLIFGEARDKWKHQIPARDYDTVEKRRIPRDYRVSLVFRHTGVGTSLHTTSSEPPDPEQHETNSRTYTRRHPSVHTRRDLRLKTLDTLHHNYCMFSGMARPSLYHSPCT